ncbi:MAG: nicotinate-nucleotide--dimethylbenzimidazole phosphoribosyltransferase [Pseudomonadota bacterium]|nr:nicotinate-nucleotide--dimethylbenzimidazole phosphoribosyltransferase [Pseudomonadota bacterium]
MAPVPGALIPTTANAVLERKLRGKIEDRRGANVSLGELAPLAVRIGLLQNSETPSLSSAQLVVFAADHGLAVDDIGGPSARSTVTTVLRLMDESTPLVAIARAQGIELTLVDSGVAETLTPHPRLLHRKIAHGTRNSRLGAAMTTEQAHAAMRAGMEIGHARGGDAVACAGIGSGSAQSAALLLACLSGAPLGEFIDAGPTPVEAFRNHLLRVLDEARNRHGHLDDPVELLAAVGGFEMAMMTGLMLAGASRRRLVVADGMAACAALLVASAIAPAVPDYCVCTRSNSTPALASALELLGMRPVFDLGVDAVDGTGAALAWPLLRSAAALLAPPIEREGKPAPGRERAVPGPFASQK